MSKLLLFAFATSLLLISSCKNGGEYVKSTDGSLTWLSIDQAAQLKNEDQKFYLVDVYTEWCGWCKVMDKETFTDNEVVQYLDEKFHVVKFDAEQTNSVQWEGKEYIYKPGGRRGINELAPYLLNKRLSYPSFAVLDKDRKLIKVLVGYKKPKAFMDELSSIIG